MQRRNQNGSPRVHPVSSRQLSSAALTTNSWKTTSASPSGRGNGRSVQEKASQSLLFHSTKIQFSSLQLQLLFSSCLLVPASGFNGGQAEEQGATIQSSADQEVPHNDDLPEQPPTDFDFNEFFTQDSMSSVRTTPIITFYMRNLILRTI